MSTPHLELDLVYHIDPAAFGLQATPDPRIEQAADWIARQFALQRLYVSIAIVDDPTIHSLNAQRLGHDWPTDVISFVLDQHRGAVEGEVIASLETAARLCAAAGWSAEDELLLYVVHGLLHVVGMDDIEPAARQAMRDREQACLLALGISQAAEHVARFEAISHNEAQS